MLILPVDGKTVMVLCVFVFTKTSVPPLEDEFGLNKELPAGVVPKAGNVLLLMVIPVGKVFVSPSVIHNSPNESRWRV
jgi:hypothetical protein